MPDLVVSPDGEIELLRLALIAELVQPRIWSLRLFENDYSPNAGTVLADLDEPTWTGYDPIDIDPAEWSTPGMIGDRALSWYGVQPQTWTPASGTHTVYGYFLTFMKGATLTLFWSQRLDSPVITTPTAPVRIWPPFTSKSEFDPPAPP